MQASDAITQTYKARLEASLQRRRRAEFRFRQYGRIAIGIASLMLCILIGSVVMEARNAFTHYRLNVSVTPYQLDTRTIYRDIRENLFETFPQTESDRRHRSDIGWLVSPLAAQSIAENLKNTPRRGRDVFDVSVPISDQADLYLKGKVSPLERYRIDIRPNANGGIDGDFRQVRKAFNDYLMSEMARLDRLTIRPLELAQKQLHKHARSEPDLTDLRDQMASLESRLADARKYRADIEAELAADMAVLSADEPSVILTLSQGSFLLIALGETRAIAEPLLEWDVPEGQIGNLLFVEMPRLRRSVNDRQIAAIEALKVKGALSSHLNTALFTNSDSSEPELAGTFGALIGSLLTMLVTMSVSIPIGIAAAVYLEEFAPKSWLTGFIQVNINNLAAVPSIVFGLLGAAIFINGIVIGIPFTDSVIQLGGGLGRGWPLAAGLVLALMTLPTIIISARSALSAVPPSTREGAMALGATPLQVVGHHILPIAAPGMLTGSIIGLAQAIGETAPLLLIGLVAFLGDVPDGLDSRSTALPVLIYQWSTRAERAWEPMTSAAIIILLLVMLVLNALAIWLRLKYERKDI